MTDLWFARQDNLRYAIDWCVFGYPDNHDAVSTPCLGSCKPIKDALQANLTDPSSSTAYGYCQDDSFMAGVDLCASCNALVNNQSYPSNCKSLPTLISMRRCVLANLALQS